MTYEQYIASDAWKKKRQQRIDFDSGQCAICHSKEGLSVHHLHYDSLGNEDVQSDLITACTRCHRHLDTIERYNRYSKRKRNASIIDSVIPERTSINHGMEDNQLSANFSLPDDRSQWTDRRPAKRYGEKVETGIIEARQDRCRL